MPASKEETKKREAAREVIDILQEMALLLVWNQSTYGARDLLGNAEYKANTNASLTMRFVNREWCQSGGAGGPYRIGIPLHWLNKTSERHQRVKKRCTWRIKASGAFAPRGSS